MLVNFYITGMQSLIATDNDASIRSQIAKFPNTPVIVWGASFPYEAAYPVFNIPASSMKYSLHAFGVFSPAPFSVAFRENHEGRSMAKKFASVNGVSIVAGDQQIQILSTYCKERLNGEMRVLSSERFGPMLVRTIRCKK